MIYYPSLLIMYFKYFLPDYINVLFFDKDNLISNVSVLLHAFYPSAQGTIIQKIYQGYDLKYLSLPVSNLTAIASNWIDYYNYSVTPSLIGFASYYVSSNGYATVYLQPFTIPISLYNITHDTGKTVMQGFTDPIILKVQNFSDINLNINISNYWFYPSVNSYGIIPLSVSYITSSNYSEYGGILSLGIQGTNKSVSDISFGITLFNKGNLTIPGYSLTLNISSVMLRNYAYFGKWNDSDFQFAEIFAFGQIAIANFTVLVNNVSIDSFVLAFVTGFFMNSNVYKPQIFSTNSPSVFPPVKFFSLASNIFKSSIWN